MAIVLDPPVLDKPVIPTEPVRRFTVDEYHLMIDAYTNPSINAELSDYQQRHTYRANDLISLVLDEQEIVRLHADDLLP